MTDLSAGRASRVKASPAEIAPASLAFILAAVTLALLALLADRLLTDPDTHWHIAVGRWIVENRAFPRTDVFSHTFAGQSWIAKEWLSQLILHVADQIGGWRGVTLVTAAAAAASVGLLGCWLALRLRDTAALGLALLALMLAAPSMLARPHVLALPLMVGWTLAMIGAAERGRRPSWLLIPLMTLWANMHAGFTIGFVIGAVAALEAMRVAGRGRWFETAFAWGAFLTLSLLASFVTPYGLEAVLITAKLFGGAESLKHIKEWQPLAFSLNSLPNYALLGLLLAVCALRPRENWARLLLIALVGFMMARHARFAMVFGFVAIPAAALALARLAPAVAAPAAGAPRSLDPRLAALGAAALALALTAAAPQPKPNPSTTPAAALAAARAHGLTGPVYNSYNFGGYLIAQRIPTFIDGRSDQLFLGGFMDSIARALELKDPAALNAVIRRHGADWALVEADSDEQRLLTAGGWSVLHQDEVAAVMAPPVQWSLRPALQ